MRGDRVDLIHGRLQQIPQWCVVLSAAVLGDVVDLGLRPVLFEWGWFQLRWYSLAYLFGIIIGWWYLLRMVGAPGAPMARRHADDLAFYATLGVILGASARMVVVAVAYTAFLYIFGAVPAFSFGWTMTFVALLAGLVLVGVAPPRHGAQAQAGDLQTGAAHRELDVHAVGAQEHVVATTEVIGTASGHVSPPVPRACRW